MRLPFGAGSTRTAGAVPAEVALTLLVDALATYRLTRLATADVITEPVRRSVVAHSLGLAPDTLAETAPTVVDAVNELDQPPKLARLITCRWCAGVWIAGGVVAARLLAPRTWDVASRGLALSAAAVLIARLEAD